MIIQTAIKKSGKHKSKKQKIFRRRCVIMTINHYQVHSQ